MLNKNDPLIGAVQEVMKRNHAEREAARLVNEKFGVTDRKALPHEKQSAWDAAYKTVLNEGVEALDELKGITSNTGARAGYMLKGIGSAVGAKLTGDKEKYAKRMKGLEGAKKKSEADTERRKEDASNNETARKILKDMGRKTGYGKIYDKMFEEEALDEAEIDHPNKKKLDVASSDGKKEPDGQLTKHDFEHLRSMKKKNLEEKAVSVAQRNLMGAALSAKRGGKPISPKVAKVASSMSTPELRKFASTKEKGLPKKKMKIDEGFNNRHDLSVTASAEKQVVADQLNEKIGNPLLLNRAKARSRMGDSGVRRPISGTNNPQTRLARMRKSAPALDSTRNAALDKPGLEKAGVAQALKDPKARETLAQTTRDAAEFAVPSAMTGGPIGNMIGRGLGTAVSKGYSYLKNLTKSAPAATKTAQSVPQIAAQGGSSGRITPSGPWGSIRNADRPPSAGSSAPRNTSPSGTFAARLQASRQATPNAAASNAARVARATARQSTPNAAASNAARMAVSQRLAQAGTKAANVVRNNPKLAAGAAGGAAMTGFAATKVGNQPPAAQAKPAKDQSRIPSGLSPADQQRKAEQDKVGVKRTQPTAPSTVAMTARKIEATPRKVSDTEIMNAPQYKQAVKAVGGPEGARKIQAGTDVAGVGKVEKGQTIWSKVKSQLEKQPVKGFEMGANKGGAGR